MKIWMKRFALMVFSLSVMGLILEGGVRISVSQTALSPLFPFRPYCRAEIHRDLRGVTSRGRFTTNRWGWRGDDPPVPWTNYLTVAAVGGSTTICDYMDDDNTWCAKLQENLRNACPRVWVGNAGLCGQSSFGHLVLMDEVVSVVRPRVTLFLVGVNDLVMTVAHDVHFEGNTFDRAELWQASWKVRLRKSSRLVQILYPWLRRIRRQDVEVTRAVINWTATPLKEKEAVLDPLWLDQGVERYAKHIQQLIVKTRAIDSAPVFLTQPMLFEDTHQWRSYEGMPAWVAGTQQSISAATLASLMTRYNDTLQRVCAAEGALCFDLASAVGHDPLLFVDSCHFTDLGAERVAQESARFLTPVIATNPICREN